jgi:chemotaxis protein MotB
MSRNDDPSGIAVYPKMDVPPPQRGSEPRVKGFPGGGGGRGLDMKKVIAGLVGALAVGGVVGYVVKPSRAGDADKAEAALADAQKNATAEKTRADVLDQQLAETKKQADQLAGKAADVDKRAAELDAQQKKLSGALDKDSGSVSMEGDEIHLKLVDKVLFATGDDQLSEKGKQVLEKVGGALKDIPDKQIWVQGHTDDQPIYLTKKKELDKPDPKAKGKKAPPPKDDKEKTPEFLRYMTNWELSAARALEVVHYLQDTSKIDGTRLAALAFGQYRPLSHKDKSVNRRIEIVLVPKREVLQKVEAPPPAPPPAKGSGSGSAAPKK